MGFSNNAKCSRSGFSLKFFDMSFSLSLWCRNISLKMIIIIASFNWLNWKKIKSSAEDDVCNREKKLGNIAIESVYNHMILLCVQQTPRYKRTCAYNNDQKILHSNNIKSLKCELLAKVINFSFRLFQLINFMRCMSKSRTFWTWPMSTWKYNKQFRESLSRRLNCEKVTQGLPKILYTPSSHTITRCEKICNFIIKHRQQLWKK